MNRARRRAVDSLTGFSVLLSKLGIARGLALPAFIIKLVDDAIYPTAEPCFSRASPSASPPVIASLINYLAQPMDIKDYPFLDRREFSAACHNLEKRYCHATLGSLRKLWKLRLCTALDAAFSVDGTYTTYVQITRPLEPIVNPHDICLGMDKICISENDSRDAVLTADQDMMDAEESDSAAIIEHKAGHDAAHVTYEIHLHPTYRVPCLWFTLHNLCADEQAFSIDTVFRRLVPDEYKDGLRTLGGVGGISADHHPITGVPAFFIHPCLLKDALASFRCSREDYLMIWLGLVGGCVNLWVPKEMAMT